MKHLNFIYKILNEELYNSVKKNILLSTQFFLFIFLLLSIVYYYKKDKIILTMLITIGTVCYHFMMRLIVGYMINNKFHNNMDYSKKWFQEKAFEIKLYKMIGVKKWKKRIPSFFPNDFSLNKNSVVDIIRVTCQAEIVHEIIMILSFIPVIFSIYIGAVSVFIITSCMAFLIDSIFVISQRYNRPRLIRYYKKQLSLLNK